MEGLNQHLEFQIKLAGGKTGAGSGNSGSTDRMPRDTDDIPDIGMMVPIERVTD